MAPRDSLTESVAIPMETLWDCMSYNAPLEHLSSIREADIYLVLIKTFCTSLGRGDAQTPVLVT
ncbi:hypothetical protein C8Q73DRAFT_795501 [Cubamyces lactineus]|nr:hypothetical protein C8Q73DRAFT_795501 [Cubamyces lactineus]